MSVWTGKIAFSIGGRPLLFLTDAGAFEIEKVDAELWIEWIENLCSFSISLIWYWVWIDGLIVKVSFFFQISCLVGIDGLIVNASFILLISVCLVRIVFRIFNGFFFFLISCLVGINGLIEPCSEFKGEKLESSQSSCPYVIVFVLFWHINCSR